MLVVPGPIVPLDWSALERRLSPDGPIDGDDSIGQAFTDAADALDTTRASMMALAAPDADDGDEVNAIDAVPPDADVVVAIAEQGVPGDVTNGLADANYLLEFFDRNVDKLNDGPIDPSMPGWKGTEAAPVDSGGDTSGDGTSGDGNSGSGTGA